MQERRCRWFTSSHERWSKCRARPSMGCEVVGKGDSEPGMCEIGTRGDGDRFDAWQSLNLDGFVNGANGFLVGPKWKAIGSFAYLFEFSSRLTHGGDIDSSRLRPPKLWLIGIGKVVFAHAWWGRMRTRILCRRGSL